ncbi:MAG: hypothetical protein ACXW11_04530 [Methylotenera sp.]
MLKKIVILMFITVISTVSAISSAASNEPAQPASSSLAIANIATNEDVRMQAASVGSDEAQARARARASVSQDTDKNKSISPAAGWILFTALIGFVILSNRGSV